MRNKEIEAILYDWHNEIKLHNQNKDINFLKMLLGDSINKKILVVGAGTGRVAIPLSDKNLVFALDKDSKRLARLKEKINLNENIKIIYKDITRYKPNNMFDIIIFPYSTMQNINPTIKQIKTLKNISRMLRKDGICIIDNSNKFGELENEDYRTICEGYCNKLEMYVIEKEKVTKYRKYIIINKKFYDKNNNIFFKKTERWNIMNGKIFERRIRKAKFKIVDKIKGYDDETSHRTIYVISKEVKEDG